MSKLYTYQIDNNLSARLNPININSNAVSDPNILEFWAGDVIAVGVQFYNGTSLDYSALTGSYLHLSLSDIGSVPYITQSKWGISSSWGYTSSLSLGGSITGSFDGDPFIQPYLQLVVTQSNGLKTTQMYQQATVFNKGTFTV